MGKTLGFIGCGNMAGAICSGAVKAGFLKPAEVFLYDVNEDKATQLAGAAGGAVTHSLCELSDRADILLMAVKPNTVQSVLDELSDRLCGRALLSIALGWDFERYSAALPTGARVGFVMPNTPCMAGEGMALLEEKNSLTEDEEQFAVGLFSSIGRLERMKSSLMGVAGTLSGCGPAFVYVMLEALADGAVLHGLPRDTAYRLAAQMVLGSGKLALESGLHPGQLKDNVCSPGGSTIKGVRALENGGFRAAVIDAIDKATVN